MLESLDSLFIEHGCEMGLIVIGAGIYGGVLAVKACADCLDAILNIVFDRIFRKRKNSN